MRNKQLDRLIKPFQREIAGLISRLGITQTELAQRADLSQSYVSGMVRVGVIPTREVVLKIADGLELDYKDRAKLLKSAGYADETNLDEESEALPQPLVSLVRDADGLNPNRIETLRWLLQDPARLDGIALLRDARVMHAFAA